MPADLFSLVRRFWWLIAAILAVIVVLVLWSQLVGLVERINPFDAESRAARAERALEIARSEISAREAESEGREAMNDANGQAQVVIIETRTITERAVTEAEGAPDAEISVGPERDARLRDWRNGLCLAHPGSCADPASDD